MKAVEKFTDLISTIDHWRSLCKGWILWPTPYTYITDDRSIFALATVHFSTGKSGIRVKKDVQYLVFCATMYYVDLHKKRRKVDGKRVPWCKLILWHLWIRLNAIPSGLEVGCRTDIGPSQLATPRGLCANVFLATLFKRYSSKGLAITVLLLEEDRKRGIFEFTVRCSKGKINGDILHFIKN
jgi:hypothetical protein